MIKQLGLLVGVAAAVASQMMMDQVMSQPKCDLPRIAHEQIAKIFPDFDPTGKKLVISESGNLWELTYELPPEMLGDVPIVTIDKRTCQVIRVQHSQ